MDKLADLLFELSMEACLNPGWFALSLLGLGAIILLVGVISTKFLEKYE